LPFPTINAHLFNISFWEPIYRDLPELRQVFKDEVKHKERNEYQKLWVRKKRHKERTFVQCKQCLECFIPKRSTATFCSSKCRLKYHRANKSPAPSSVKDLEVYFDSNIADWYKDKSFEWFKKYGSKMV